MTNSTSTKKRPRKKLKITLTILFLITIWLLYTNLVFTTTTYKIVNSKIPSNFNGYKIIQISDLHNFNWRGRLARKVKQEKPDIIVITGDFVDSSHTDIATAMKFIEKVKSVCTIYYVTGNHEAWLDNAYTELEQKLENSGVTIMHDEALFIEKDSQKIQLIGLKDPDFTNSVDEYAVVNKVLKDKILELIDPDYYNITLSHRPERFIEYVESGTNLVLTGHAHGGQFRLPFIGGLIAPNQGFFPKYTSGIHHDEQTDMIVSRGLGNSIIPVRINNMPELVVITLANK